MNDIKNDTSEAGFVDIPRVGFIRLKQILKVFPVGERSWWRGVKSGKYPQPIKLAARTTAWKARDIIELIQSYEDTGEV